MRPVRIGLIGAGRMGRRHLDALVAAPGVIVAGVAEPMPSARAAVAAAGHPVHDAPDGLLADRELDGVVIAAPSDQHVALVGAAAARGLPALCEKPIGVRRDDALAALAAVRKHRTLLRVGYWRRFVPALQALRARIAAGELGEIVALSCLQWDGEPPAAQFRAHSGGIAVDMAVHEFDQARWLTGQDVRWVSAAGAGGPAADAGSSPAGRDPDAALLLAAMDGGAALSVSVGRRFPHGDCCWLEVFGTAGYERVPFMWGEAGEAVFTDALVAQAAAFAAAVRGEEPEGAGGEDAVAALTAAELAGDALGDGRQRTIAAAAR